MRLFALYLALLCITGAAAADLLDSFPPNSVKDDSHVGINPGTPDGRDGGETLDDAIVIPGLPFEDTGNTCDNIDDYDETCPYDSMSPEVVYAFTPTEDLTVNIDLCESDYDTKVYLYENEQTIGMPFACNDDADCTVAYRSAILMLDLFAGNTYYIVVDGYGSDCGDFLLTIDQFIPCVLECPADGTDEGEPPLVTGYIDDYNSGCSHVPPLYQPIDFTTLCGVSGWYTTEGTYYRDTDWFTCIADTGGFITASARAEWDLNLFVLWPLDCNEVDVLYQTLCGCDITGTIEFAHDAGTEAWIWTGSPTYDGPESEFDYILNIDGIELDIPSPVDHESWGGIKQQFR
jgi:hypothetical protein